MCTPSPDEVASIRAIQQEPHWRHRVAREEIGDDARRQTAQHLRGASSPGPTPRNGCSLPAQPSEPPGRPDFANRARGWALFVHGCFWHGHRDCKKTKGGRRGRIPSNNADYWAAKMEANRERDKRKTLEIQGLGLRVLTVWECELRDSESLRAKIAEFLDPAS